MWFLEHTSHILPILSKQWTTRQTFHKSSLPKRENNSSLMSGSSSQSSDDARPFVSATKRVTSKRPISSIDPLPLNKKNHESGEGSFSFAPRRAGWIPKPSFYAVFPQNLISVLSLGGCFFSTRSVLYESFDLRHTVCLPSNGRGRANGGSACIFPRVFLGGECPTEFVCGYVCSSFPMKKGENKKQFWARAIAMTCEMRVGQLPAKGS